ncbi:hypothetical protein [Empedobacter brevis]|uniref:hypothetical protein n=1 Tax=Empedobacter brevis TaxID=247 RepID=UPI0039AF8668
MKIFNIIFEKKYNMSILFKTLVEQVASQGYKSNIIKPLLGMMVIFLLGVIATKYYEIPFIPYIFMVLITICGIGMLFTYFYCLFKNPDLLRSEKYNLEKNAIEKVSIVGDSEKKASINLPTSEYVIIKGDNDRKMLENE